MASKNTPVNGNKRKIARLMDIAKKGSDLWNEYGDSVKKGVASFIKRDDNSKDHEPKGSLATQESDAHDPVLCEQENETDTFFEDQQARLYNVVIKDTVLGGNLSNPQQCLAALNEIYSVADETIRYCEEQETKRETIRAERDIAIARIKEMGDLVKVYLEKTFDERLALFNKQFEAIGIALQSGNVEMLAVTLNRMNELASSSPFKSLADIQSVQQNLIEQSEWDI